MKTIWLRSKGREALPIEAALQEALAGDGFHLAETPESNIDLCISVGGDGTFLAALRELGDKRFDIPVLGVHGSAGRGFLLPLNTPKDRATLSTWAKQVAAALKAGKFSLEERWGLGGKVTAREGGTSLDGLWALNDMVVTRSALSRLVWLRVLVDGRELLTKLRGDGVVISSAPGSTAYSLSAGGPVVHPSLKNMIVTPICPQSLAHRSVVLGESVCVRIEILENDTPSYLTDDGQAGRELRAGDSVTITRASRPVKFLVPTEPAPMYEEYFQVLRHKLGFGGE